MEEGLVEEQQVLVILNHRISGFWEHIEVSARLILLPRVKLALAYRWTGCYTSVKRRNRVY